jgi:hypothetical protein
LLSVEDVCTVAGAAVVAGIRRGSRRWCSDKIAPAAQICQACEQRFVRCTTIHFIPDTVTGSFRCTYCYTSRVPLGLNRPNFGLVVFHPVIVGGVVAAVPELVLPERIVSNREKIPVRPHPTDCRQPTQPPCGRLKSQLRWVVGSTGGPRRDDASCFTTHSHVDCDPSLMTPPIPNFQLLCSWLRSQSPRAVTRACGYSRAERVDALGTGFLLSWSSRDSLHRSWRLLNAGECPFRLETFRISSNKSTGRSD